MTCLTCPRDPLLIHSTKSQQVFLSWLLDLVLRLFPSEKNRSFVPSSSASAAAIRKPKEVNDITLDSARSNTSILQSQSYYCIALYCTATTAITMIGRVKNNHNHNHSHIHNHSPNKTKKHGFHILSRVLLLCVLASAAMPFFLDEPDQNSNTIREEKPTLNKGANRRIVAPVVEEAPSLLRNTRRMNSTQNTTLHKGATQRRWSNDRDIVHVVYTRFMQHQPNLVALGLARLELFVTFCLPTITQQTNKQFLWIIRTDPDLHTILRDGLLQAVGALPNVVVVGSNEIKKGSIDGGFRSKDAIDDIAEDSLLFGSLELVKSFHKNARKRNVLETNLDADDGLGLSFVETIQNMTYHRFKDNKRRTAWLNICPGRHLEWQYYAPWDVTTDKGSLVLGSTHVCITAGLSWATMMLADPEFEESHHLIKKETKDCTTFHKPHLGCWEELPDKELMAIRARTPTSTGMARVLSSEEKWKQEDLDADKAHWSTLASSFGISQKTIEQSRRYLTDHMDLIVEDNLKGQCRKDHSCSEGIKTKLKKILYKDNMWKNKHDLVHVIQTWLDSPLSIHVLDKFGFASLAAQTTYEFLWIIRLKQLEEDDEEEIQNFLTSKVVGKSPLNILVVKSDQTSTLDFRNTQSVEDIVDETLLYGDMTMLQDFHQASQNRTLLETTLEPSDALSKTFVENIQKSTVRQLKASQMMDDESGWYYQCNSQYIGWNYFTPEGYEADSGFLSLIGPDDINCVDNPGVTRISLPGAQIPYFSDTKQTGECEMLVVLQYGVGVIFQCFQTKP